MQHKLPQTETTCTPEADDADERARALLQGLHHEPVPLRDMRDVVVAAEGAPVWIVPARLVATVASQLGGPELVRALEAVPYEPDRVRVVVLVGHRAAVTTLDARAMTPGGST
jgi:hypothetical protein